MGLSHWLRRNSEQYLMEAAQNKLAARYLGEDAVSHVGPPAVFWRRIFVPVYTRLPWSLRHFIITTMPGSHRRRWRAFDTPPRTPGI